MRCRNRYAVSFMLSACLLAKLGYRAELLLLQSVTARTSHKTSGAVTPASIKFIDVAPRSRFSYKTNNNFTGRKYFPQPMCGGVALFDIDNDGKLDIFFTNGAKLPELEKSDASFYHCLLRNRGDGTFEDITEKAGLGGRGLGFSFGVAVGDYDNDGRADLFVCNAGRNALYHHKPDGTFVDVTTGSGLEFKPRDTLSVCAAWFDYDNDGRLDIVVSNYTDWSPDSDNRCLKDGVVDIYCHPATYKSVPSRLYHNMGEGKFVDVTEKAGFAGALGKGMGISISDINGDGYSDVFIANDTERNFFFINQSNGTFKEVGLLYGVAYNDQGASVSAMGSDANDFNNDGWDDVFYNNLAGQLFGLFKNLDGKSFEYASPACGIELLSRAYSGWSAAFVDYNNDGWKDIYSANGDVDNLGPRARQHDSMFENVQGKTFLDVSAKLGADFCFLGFQRGGSVGDLNNDGFPDLVVTSLDQRPRILLNSASNDNHWLVLNTAGRSSNRDGIGAKIKLTTKSGRTLFNHVTTSVGFMSSSDKRVHFGLGDEASIKSIEIRWPNGVIQQLEAVAADQILKVEEPRK
jgi:enediyne biosynthesis protein E4